MTSTLDDARGVTALDYYIWDWKSLLWDALGDQTKVDRVIELATLNGMFDPIRAAGLAADKRCDAGGAKVERDRIIETCATVAEGFDAACNSPRMKLFVEAGLVVAIYKRDGEIGAAIRELKNSPVPPLVSPPSEAGREEIMAIINQHVTITERWDGMQILNGLEKAADAILALSRPKHTSENIERNQS